MGEDIKRFPAMIYHPKESPKIVQSQEEMDEFLSKGWRTIPVPQFMTEAIKDQIKWHEDELKTLHEELEKLEPTKEVEVKKKVEVKKEEKKVPVRGLEVKT